MKYCFTSPRIAKIKKSDNYKCLFRYREIRTLGHCGGSVKWCDHFGEPSGNSSKTRHRHTIGSSHPTARYILKRIEDMPT